MNLLPVVDQDGTRLVFDPETGTGFSLSDAPAAVIARAAAYLDDYIGQARRFRASLADEMQLRLGMEKKLDVGSHMVEKQDTRKWDDDQTWAALSRLLELGLVTSAQIEDAMPEKTIRKPDGRKLNSLLAGLLGTAGDVDRDRFAAIQALAQARDTKTYIKIQATATAGTAVPA